MFSFHTVFWGLLAKRLHLAQPWREMPGHVGAGDESTSTPGYSGSGRASFKAAAGPPHTHWLASLGQCHSSPHPSAVAACSTCPCRTNSRGIFSLEKCHKILDTD